MLPQSQSDVAAEPANAGQSGQEAVANGGAGAPAQDTTHSARILQMTSDKVLDVAAMLNTGGVPFGAVVEPLAVPVGQGQVPFVSSPMRTCMRCGSFLNAHCTVEPDGGAWVCCFCSVRNKSPTYQLGAGDTVMCPELSSEAVDYFGGYLRTDAGVETATPQVVIAIDATIDEDQMDVVRRSLTHVVEGLPPSTRIGIVSFDASVSVYDLASEGVVSASIIPGDRPPSAAALEHLTRPEGGLQPVRPVADAGATAAAIISALRPYTHYLSHRDRPRCLGAAIDTALYIASGGHSKMDPGDHYTPATARSSRVIVVTGGPATYGPGHLPLEVIDGDPSAEDELARARAFEYFRGLGAAAAAARIPVDVFAGGTRAAHVPLLDELTSAASGATVLFETYGELFTMNVAGALQRTQGVDGVFDVYASEGVSVARLIGPLQQLREAGSDSDDDEDDGITPGAVMARSSAAAQAAAASEGGSRILSPNACKVTSLEIGQGFCVLLHAARDVRRPLCVQLVLRWCTLASHEQPSMEITRVVTRRLPVVSSLSLFLKSLNVAAAAILMAKTVVLSAQKSGAAARQEEMEDLQRSMGTTLADMAQRLGTQKTASSGFMGLGLFGVSHEYVLPKELAPFAYALYQLHRGAMLGDVVGHPDERALLFALFLRADSALAARMCAPRLWRLDPRTGAWEEVPPVDFALDSSTAALLDNGTHIYVWLGSGIASGGDAAGGLHAQLAIEDSCKAYAGQVAMGRFPIPELRICTERHGDARYMASRLAPLYRETAAQMVAAFPALQHASPAAIAARRAALIEVETPSFREWCAAARVAAPEGAWLEMAAPLG